MVPYRSIKRPINMWRMMPLFKVVGCYMKLRLSSVIQEKFYYPFSENKLKI